VQAFFHGGLYANDATTPVNGSHMEVMDLRTMSPYVIQVGGSQLKKEGPGLLSQQDVQAPLPTIANAWDLTCKLIHLVNSWLAGLCCKRDPTKKTDDQCVCRGASALGRDLCAILPVRVVLVPSCVQVESNPELNTTRYNHFLAVWKDQLLAVAGQVDDGNGKSDQVLNVLVLDLNTRRWRAIKNFTTPNGAGECYNA
jgi:hypothetical protein